ncbi:MAG: hypothetical protein ACRDZQ_05480 [Acidimicrobiales bacterium]
MPERDIVAFLRPHAGAFRCPKCRRSLADCKLRQIGREGPRYTVEVTCRNCELVLLVVLELASPAAVESEDAETVEVEVLPAAEPISNEELLDLHRALMGHRGPLTALLQDRSDHA